MSNKISVCIATYNGGLYIKQQLLSILAQLSNNDEIIVSDDGSTDDTIDVINSLNDYRIVIYKGNFKNLIKNFENAISKSTGDIIFLSDQDDIWKPNKVKKMTEKLSLEYDIVLHDCEIVTSDNNIINDSFFKFRSSKAGLIRNLLKRNSYMGCCLAFNAKMKSYILPFPKKIPMHDLWIGLIGELFFKPLFLDDKLLQYRQHPNNSSDTSTGLSKYSFLRKIHFRIITSYYLIKRVYKMRFV